MIAPRTFSFRGPDKADRWRAFLAQIALDHERAFLTAVLTDPEVDDADIDLDALDACVADHRRFWADAIEQDIDIHVFMAFLAEHHIGLV